MQLSIIIVNYNSRQLLENCINSLQRAIQNSETEIIIVDNNSTDDSWEYIKSLRLTGYSFKMNDNFGFAKACNGGFGVSHGKYVLFLNPDTIVTENSLQDCISFLESHPDAGAIGVRMINSKNQFLKESKRGLPTPAASFYKLFGLSVIFPKSKTFSKYYEGHLPEKENNPVEVLSGAFMMIRREVFEKVNGFDERFFMYGEDIDLCYRIQQAGYKIYYLGTETIIHFKGESSKQRSTEYVKMFYHAMMVFVKKHYNNAWLTNFTLHAGIYLRAFASFITSPFKRKKIYRKEIDKNKFLLIGDPFSAAEAENIINKNFQNVSIKKLQSLQSLSGQENEFDKIIFCNGRFSYKESIGFINRLKNKYQYMWHGMHTKSIVGSSDKEFTGEAIAEV